MLEKQDLNDVLFRAMQLNWMHTSIPIIKELCTIASPGRKMANIRVKQPKVISEIKTLLSWVQNYV